MHSGRRRWAVGAGALLSLVLAGSAAARLDLVASPAGIAAPQNHDGVRSISPNGGSFTAGTTITFTWQSDWYNPSFASTLHFYVGTSPGGENIVHEHTTCPASPGPGASCPTQYFGSFTPGNYWWGVAHEFPAGDIHVSDALPFTVVAAPPPPAAASPTSAATTSAPAATASAARRLHPSTSAATASTSAAGSRGGRRLRQGRRPWRRRTSARARQPVATTGTRTAAPARSRRSGHGSSTGG